VVSTGRFPTGGVFIYALMAAGGDLGASVGPQLMGTITDLTLAAGGTEQLGMKIGLLVGSLFPLIALPLYLHVWRKWRKDG